jgi:serine/threonine protein phosphatase 1
MRWIIGDIHGMFPPLETLLGAIAVRDREARLIFVGDYVNRGPSSRQVIDLLLTLPNASFVRGNHDDTFDQVLHDSSLAGKRGDIHRLASFQWFMQFGLDETFKSYGATDHQLDEIMRKPSMEALHELNELVPAAHRKFIHRLPPVLEFEDIFVAHAKWETDRKTTPNIQSQLARSDELRQTIIWGRYTEDEIGEEKAWDRTGYFGHTPVTTYAFRSGAVPVIGPKIVLVDTGAALPEGRRLTAFCPESKSFIQADATGKMVSS